MKWPDIKRKYPDKCILLGNFEEEEIEKHKYRILGGEVLLVSDDFKEVVKAGRKYKAQGKQVVFSLPSPPEDFIIESIPFRGMA